MSLIFKSRIFKRINNHWCFNNVTSNGLDKILNLTERFCTCKRNSKYIRIFINFSDTLLKNPLADIILIKNKIEDDNVEYKLGKHSILLPVKLFVSDLPNYIYINNINVL